MDCIWLNLKNVGHLFSYLGDVSLYMYQNQCHLHSRKIILSCYVVMILQMKDSWSANLTFRAHNWQYYRKIRYLTREFRVKLHAKTDIARIARLLLFSFFLFYLYRFSRAI